MSSPPTINNFTADPPIAAPNTGVTLIWSTSGATGVTISGVGSVAVSGETVVTPTATTTYTLTASNAAGPTTEEVTVTIAALPLLTYVVTPNAVPYSEGRDTSTVSLLIVATNSTSNTVACTEIAFVFPIGDDADDLVSSANASGISPAPTSGTPWTINGSTGAFTAFAKTGTTGIGPGDAIGFLFTGVIVNDALGTAAIEVQEYSQTPPAAMALEVTKTPQGLAITSFFPNPVSVSPGGQSTLTWTTTGASSVTITPTVGSVDTSGSKYVSPQELVSYTLTASGSGQTTSQSVVISVAAPAITSFTASPPVINLGDSTTLYWTTVNASYAYLNPGNVNISKSLPSGSQNVTPTKTTTYLINVAGANHKGTNSQSTPVTINPVVISSFTVSPTSVSYGDSATLYWTVAGGPTSLSINGVTVTGTSKTITPKKVSNIYTLIANGYAGPQSTNVTVSVTDVPPVINSFAFNPNRVNLGENTTLSWSTQYATQVTLNGPNAQKPSNSITATLTGNSVYTLRAYGPHGKYKNDNGYYNQAFAPVYVNPVVINSLQFHYPRIYSSPTSVSWSTTSAASCTLNGQSVATNGSQSLSGGVGAQTLYCTGANGTTATKTLPAPQLTTKK